MLGREKTKINLTPLTITDMNGPVAQWITRLPTEQEIPGSSPGRLGAKRFVLLCQPLVIAHVKGAQNKFLC